MRLTSNIESPKRPPFFRKSSKGQILLPGFCSRSLDSRRPPFPVEKMGASAGLVAGSHNRNELVIIRRHGKPGPKPLQQISGQICQISGDVVGPTANGKLFVACNECIFPICRTCYEYERREGSQVCPQCKARFKRLWDE